MATRLLNRAQINYTFNGSGASAISNQTTTTLLDQYTMSVTKDTLTPEVKACCNATYVVRVENNGTGTLSDITVRDNLGAGRRRSDHQESERGHDQESEAPLTYVEDSAVFYLNGTEIEGTAQTNRRGVTFETDTPLEPGDNLLIIYVATLDSAQTKPVTNTATVTARTGSASRREITESDTATIRPIACAAVSIFKTADRDTVMSGDTLTYTFTLMNSGFKAADEITLTDEFPEEFTVTSVSYTSNGVTTPVSSDDYTITGDTLTLPASGSELVIGVPAAKKAGPGITTITITGTVA